MGEGKEELVKIIFELDADDWHGYPSETVWAAIVRTEEGQLFELQNSPFYMRGVSYLDLVRASPLPEEPHVLNFTGVFARSGHSTYWLLVPPEKSAEFEERWKMLAVLGCSYESGTIRLQPGVRKLYSVDVPPATDIHSVYRLLQDGEEQSVWLFAEGHCGHQI